MNLFIGSLPYDLEEEELRELFEEYGQVSSVKIITDRATGKSKGFGFVEMPNDQQAAKAMDELDGAEIDGRTIAVKKAEDKRDRDSSRGGGNFKGGYGGGKPGFNKGNSRGRGEGSGNY